MTKGVGVTEMEGDLGVGGCFLVGTKPLPYDGHFIGVWLPTGCSAAGRMGKCCKKYSGKSRQRLQPAPIRP